MCKINSHYRPLRDSHSDYYLTAFTAKHSIRLDGILSQRINLLTTMQMERQDT